MTIEGEKTGEKIDAEKTGEKIAGEDAKTVEGEKTGEKIEGEKTGMETPQLADQVGEQQTPSPGWVDQAAGIVHRPLNQAAGPGEKIEGEKTGEPSLKRQRTLSLHQLSLLDLDSRDVEQEAWDEQQEQRALHPQPLIDHCHTIFLLKLQNLTT